jgi:hypothetical protein
MALSRQTNIAIQHSAVVGDAWRADDRRLAERFRQAMVRARSEVGQGGSFAAVLRKAWASDPDLRGLFGAAVSSGLRKMWADVDARAEQSRAIKQSYTQDLRKQRSEALKENWANAAFRERMLRSSSRLANGRFGPRDDVKGVCND